MRILDALVLCDGSRDVEKFYRISTVQIAESRKHPCGMHINVFNAIHSLEMISKISMTMQPFFSHASQTDKRYQCEVLHRAIGMIKLISNVALCMGM